MALITITINSASAATALAARATWFVNHQPFVLTGTIISKPAKKITIKLPGNLEVVCEKIKSPAETGVFDAGGSTEASLDIGSFSAEECNKVVNLEASEEEKCEVEAKTITFNELGARIPWIEATGSERYVYIYQALHNGAWETSDPLWTTIKIKSIAGKTCPSLLTGMHPLNGQMLAKLKLPTSEQVKKTFTSVESGGSCGKASTYYEGEPRTSHSSEGLMIGGEKGAELCGEFEIGLESGEEFAVG